MKISAVIPFWSALHLEECLASLAACPCVSEVLAVGDGSDWGEAEFAESYVREHALAMRGKQDIALVRHVRPLGPSAARNTGLRMVTNDWCLILDSDDRIVSLDAQVSALDFAEKDTGFVMGSWRSFDDKGTSFSDNPPELPTIATLSLSNMAPVTAIVRVEAWRQLRAKNGEGYDESVVRLGGGEDWLFWLELLALGWRGLAAPGLMWEYRVGGQQHEKRDRNTFLIRAYVHQKMKQYGVFIPMEYPSA